MKAQFATIETLISFAIIASALVFVSHGISNTNLDFLTQRGELVRSMGIYDFFNQITKNSSANNCISSLILSNTSECTAELENYYMGVYGFSGVQISLNNLTSLLQKNGTKQCMNVFLNGINQTRNVCATLVN